MQTPYKNNAVKENSPQTVGKQKEQTCAIEELPDRENPALTLTEKPGASFNPSPDHMSESSEAETQTVESRKPTKVGYVFRDIN